MSKFYRIFGAHCLQRWLGSPPAICYVLPVLWMTRVTFAHIWPNKGDDNILYTQGEVTSQSLWSRYDRHFVAITRHKKGKVFPYSLPSVGPGADPGVQAVSPQVT